MRPSINWNDALLFTLILHLVHGRYLTPMVPRRDLLLGSVALATLPTARAEPARAEGPARYKAIAFDGFPIIDPRPIALRAEALFPGRGARLMEAWRTRQFEYTWLRTLSGLYADFWQITQDALVVAAAASQLDLTPDLRDGLMRTFLELKAWPDVASALAALKARGLRMAFLANPTVEMLETPMRNSGLEGLLEAPLSSDRVQAYKPDPRAYQMGLDAFGLKRDEIVFAASASWDAAGAKAFGYPSFWVNRANLPVEALGAAPDAIGSGMADLVAFVMG
jgi:2-haloacid dehalogenase